MSISRSEALDAVVRLRRSNMGGRPRNAACAGQAAMSHCDGQSSADVVGKAGPRIPDGEPIR